MAESVRISGLTKIFACPEAPDRPVVAVREVDLEVREGELVTLLGPSGCGKTTLLRMIAGFEEPSAGEIRFGERLMNQVPPNRQDAAMVFQSYAIFPHLDVYENVAFGLRLRSLERGALAARVERVLALTGLEPMARRSPSQLSGGQQQRVALARAIVMEPKVLLFDEPLSNLDAKLREQMRVEIRDLQQRLGITSLYVTHDQVEAMSISDRIVVMNGGVVEQVDTPHDVYVRPATRFVADFIGKANFATARVVAEGEVELAGHRLRLASGTSAPVGAAVTLVVRPETVRLSAEAGALKGVVQRAMFLGNIVEYTVEVPGVGIWLVDQPNPAENVLHEVGGAVFLEPSALAAQAIKD
jgi:iron(III) transport system ATP-binding protein